ncbi:MAG: hypothetical protein K0V04_09330 [Deltaproteobacteria bacterium]|nr:hypothetical protein [Deltaproteobacteria bacterium]
MSERRPSSLCNALTRIGETLLHQGHAAAALPPLEQVHLLHAELEADPGFAGDTRDGLAAAPPGP